MTDTVTHTLPVVEILGPTVQGEGPHVGRRAALIRLGGCNLTCETCDTRYAWDRSEPIQDVSVTAISEQLIEMTGGMDACQLGTNRPFHQVIITGGEPLVHQGSDAFRDLVLSLLAGGISVEIETNGTITPAPWFLPHLSVVDDIWVVGLTFVVSPKVVGGLATDAEAKRVKGESLRWFRDNGTRFKIVCRTVTDVERVGTWADTNGIRRHRIWIMAEGATWSAHITRARILTEIILAEGMNISTRLHLALWPAETRGR